MMPCHDFADETTGETITVYVPASAPTEQHSRQEVNGKVYKRVYSAPLAAVDLATRHGDATRADFHRVTANKRGLRLGDGWEISQEMSAKREQREGCDPVKERYYHTYEQENGERHPDVVRKEKLARANAKLGEMGIRLSL